MTQTFRATPSSYIVLVGLLSISVLPWLAVAIQRGVIEFEALLLAIALPVSFAVWLAGFRLEISTGGISYRSLFGGVRSAQLSEIESITTSRVAPVSGIPLGITVCLRNGSAFIINTKPFPAEAIELLMACKAQDSQADGKI